MATVTRALLASSLLAVSTVAACTAPLPIFDDAGSARDAGSDAAVAMDAGFDAGPPMDGGSDAGLDAAVPDAGTDAGTDAGFDAGPPPGILDVAAANDFTCALLDTGVVYCWGIDHRGQLGDGSTDGSFASDRPEPMPVVGITTAAALASGFDATCAVLEADGSARCWGLNSPARFGDGLGTSSVATPEELFFPAASEPILELDHTGSHLCLRTADKVYCSGYNGVHQLGREGAGSHILSQVEGLPFGRTPRSVAVGYSSTQGFSLVALDDGTVWCWGASDDSECGGAPISEVVVPTQVMGLSRIVEVDAGSDFACARDDTGSVFCWGDNSDGRTGNGTDGGPDLEVPTRVGVVPAVRELSIALGTVVVELATGEGVWGWGDNDNGQLGLGPGMVGVRPTPLPLLLAAGSDFEAEAAGNHSCLIERRAMAPDRLLCAGSNSHFQLGVRTATDPTRFTAVAAFPP